MPDKKKSKSMTEKWANKPKKPAKSVGKGLAEKARKDLKGRDAQLKKQLRDAGA